MYSQTPPVYETRMTYFISSASTNLSSSNLLPLDRLNREPFVNVLLAHIEDLAEIPLEEMPSPRVLAVDGPWGHGKSWIASRLQQELGHTPGRKTVLIDAFRYDHHDDAFAVIASALMAALVPEGERRIQFLKAAGSVLKAAAPALVKLAANAGLKAAGVSKGDLAEAVSDLKDAAVEGAADFSAEAVEKLFKRYSQTQAIQDRFIAALSSITSQEKAPVVVIIDELDRCRPSFALEFLERIKHLFDAENIVFVLLWHSHAIHEAVRHTYGRMTHVEAYLSKFVALNLPLALAESPLPRYALRYENLIEAQVKALKPTYSAAHVAGPIALAAEHLQPSVRDIKAVTLQYLRNGWATSGTDVYLPFLMIAEAMQPGTIVALKTNTEETAAALALKVRLDENAPSIRASTMLRATLIYLSRLEEYKQAARESVPDEKFAAVLRDSENGSYVSVLQQCMDLISKRSYTVRL